MVKGTLRNRRYQEELVKAMSMLAKDKNTIFIGQTVRYPGSPMYSSLVNVPLSKRIEVPVFEDTQMGMSIGLYLGGFIPISIFPRIDFLICATNQLVNHLDKLREMSRGQFNQGVIIRTQVGNNKPIDPGPQHMGDYTKGLKAMLKHTLVLKLNNWKQIAPAYELALARARAGQSTLLIERGSRHWQL